MPTLLTDPRSGGVKKKSGVNVLPIIEEAWARVRDDDDEMTFLLATYEPNSKTNITLLHHGSDADPMSAIFAAAEKNDDHNDMFLLPPDTPIFGGLKLPNDDGSGGGKDRFASFLYMGPNVGVMKRGRASMHRNGVLNVLEGCGELTGVDVWLGMRAEHVGMSQDECPCESYDATDMSKKCYDHDSNDAIGGERVMQKVKENNAAGNTGNTFIERKRATRVDVAPSSSSHHTKSNTTTEPSVTSHSLTNVQEVTRNDVTTTIKDFAKEEGVESTNMHAVQTDPSTSSSLTSIPYEELKNMDLSATASSSLTDIDPARKEMALSDDEFHHVFGMSKEMFVSLPKWKQTRMKKDVSLF